MLSAIEQGLRRHIEDLRRRWDAGEPRLGWKVGFNAAAIQQSLGLPYSLVAGITERTLTADKSHSLAGGTRVALEGEVAVRLGTAVDAGGGAAGASAAVVSVAPAIEVVDLDRPLEQLEEVLAHGIFHRALALGQAVDVSDGGALRGMGAQVSSHGKPLAEVDAEQASGVAGDVLLHLAQLLASAGEGLVAGDIVILGSMNPFVFPEAGSSFSVRLGDGAPVELQFTD